MEIGNRSKSHQTIHFLSPLLSSLLSSTMVIFLLALLAFSSPVFVSSATPTTAVNGFTPVDNFLFACGAKTSPKTPDGRVFKNDQGTTQHLDTQNDVLVSIPSADNVSSPIYLSARIFHEHATYKFTLKQPGWHFVRLHFFPFQNDQFDLAKATFSVSTDKLTLLHNYRSNNNTQPLQKEYLMNLTEAEFFINFLPMKSSAAFINAIEVVSAPDDLISDSGAALFPVGDFSGLSTFSYQTVYRVNMGGPLVTPQNDTLQRTWLPDKQYLQDERLAADVSVPTTVVKYKTGVTPLIAPQTIYSTAAKMAESQTIQPNFNVTWNFDADPSFSYLVRMHFCDIVSKSLNDLYFNVYINGKTAVSGLDLSSLTGGLAIPYYKDIVVNATLMSSNQLVVQIGPMNEDTGTVNAILNGLEVMK
ncbi:probable receptor-like protein kinase At4g39110, partial [Carica papaya]|uniref:probable receptor-like protein kinase At4g39110 n=1 Tax=Carica papaya TaxID=3649 RepID=UPI000B8CE6E2